MFIWDFVLGDIMDQFIDWVYAQLVGFFGNFFSQMGNMGVELFEMSWVQSIGNFFGWGTWPNTICYGFLIFIFTYFYTAISVNIKDLADNMKKYGGFIPGIRPGQPTMMYVDKVLSRITLTGAVFLAFIAILPNFIGNITGIQGVYFGGTSLLIIVGVALDTMRQAQSYMVTRNYQGFIK